MRAIFGALVRALILGTSQTQVDPAYRPPSPSCAWTRTDPTGRYVWAVLDAARAMRDGWTEADGERRIELWQALHLSANIARTALNLGPVAAEEADEAIRRPIPAPELRTIR